ncbi:MAG: prephenate dehydrogenase/arogenate dehydrogenase family protein [Candidatus Poribacteria bacterium]|nr:prephenate dehydrogenase/arogenate dehydrogenase family protein [Candidatus Poribacteria bacterium]
MLSTVGILSPGDMGHTVGNVLRENGLRVITCLDGRSQRTRQLAEKAGIEDVPTYPQFVTEADLILSIMVPAQAMSAASVVAETLQQVDTTLTYTDCNAIAPQTVRKLGDIITSTGGTFVDASIIGPPPRNPGATRFYTSGPDLSLFSDLNNYGLDVRAIGAEIGLASAIKMCYASLTKGLTALCTELLTAASVLGVSDALTAEFQLSQSALFERMERGLPGMPPKARRWIGEMEEISATFAHVGLTPNILTGAADMYRFVGDTHLADLPPEARDEFPTLAELIEILAENLKTR